MSGNSLVIDTNIILYLLNGDETLVPILEDKQLYISFVTQLELLSFHKISTQDIKIIMEFIDDCVVIDIPHDIKKQAIKLRRNYKIKLPDAIVAATANYLNSPLLTADKGFKKLEKNINLIYYQK
jgi:predicted nucleic acid-binding protein